MSAESDHEAAVQAVEQQVVGLIGHVRRAMTQAAQAVHPDLPPFGLRVLRHLDQQGPSSAGDVAEVLVSDPSTVSRQTKQLEKFGFVSIEADPDDRRSRIISLTDLGRERLLAAGPDGKIKMRQALREWSGEDLRLFAEYLDRFTKARGNN